MLVVSAYYILTLLTTKLMIGAIHSEFSVPKLFNTNIDLLSVYVKCLLVLVGVCLHQLYTLWRYPDVCMLLTNNVLLLELYPPLYTPSSAAGPDNGQIPHPEIMNVQISSQHPS